ncbi:MAG: beta-glucosidase BglX [Bacteroidales bacterium]
MKFRKSIIALSTVLLLSACSENKKSQEDLFINNLISQMTIDEKIGQMNQVAWGNWSEMARKGEIGSVLNITDIREINKMQRSAVEESRLGIPVLVSRDVIHGYRTMMPIPLGQAASFNPLIVEQGARVAAIEATAEGIRWTFAPMVDISRDPRWGRIAESCGEDPYLNSVMGVAMVKGFQGDSLNAPASMAACVKHFVGYGAAEGGRDYNSTKLTENELRNIYLQPFQAACDAGAATYMTSFNDNDGIPCTANKFILRDILRNEWGFDGFVVSDWASVAEMVPHGFVADKKEAALKALLSGVNMEMVSGSYAENIKELLKEGKLRESDVDNAVRDILRVKYRLGLFENPYVDTTLHVAYADKHLAVAKQAALEGVILLKNDNRTLPLDENKIKTLAIVGPMADAPYEQMGTWSFDGEKEQTVTPLNAIRSMVGDKVKIIYEPGLAYSREINQSGIAKSVSAARQSDAVVVFVGEEAILSGEAHSLADLNLVGGQKELISALQSTGKPVIMVVMAGRPLTIGDEIAKVNSVLYTFHPGTMGGPAIADLLFGKAVPSGKTPVTFPKLVGQIPMYYNHKMTGRPATRTETLMDSIPVEAGQTSLGCTSFYLDAGFDPLYPFGYGLSYTTFEYGLPNLNAGKFSKKDEIIARCKLTNTGEYEATEVAQLYVRDLVGSLTRPIRELKGFQRISLKPGETKDIVFNIPVTDLAYWNADMKHEVEDGEFQLWISTDSQSGNPVHFTVQD